MIQKLDVNSDEFINELEITKNFTQKVCEQFGFVYNPENDVNESVQQGLIRNKIIYGKRFCPCFMVIGETKEEQKQQTIEFVLANQLLKLKFPTTENVDVGFFARHNMPKTML